MKAIYHMQPCPQGHDPRQWGVWEGYRLRRQLSYHHQRVARGELVNPTVEAFLANQIALADGHTMTLAATSVAA